MYKRQALSDDVAIDFVAVVPLQLQTILDTQRDERLNSLKAILVGGAPVGDTLGDAIQRLNVPVFSTYGMTETVSHVALRRLNGEEATDSYGLLEGVEAATDERGCLRLRGAVTNHQWIQTNDVVEFLGPRKFIIVGRADNIINSGGVKIQLEKVERAIEKTGLIASRFFAWSEPDERLGQKLILVVESEKKLDTELLQTRLLPELLTYELPKKVYFVKKFVETPTGKVDTVSYTHLDVYKRQPKGQVVVPSGACFYFSTFAVAVFVKKRTDAVAVHVAGYFIDQKNAGKRKSIIKPTVAYLRVSELSTI